MLTQIPSFQQDGKFSQQRYEAVLRQNGRTPAQFENELRQAFMLEAISSPVSLAAFPSNTSLTQIARLVAQQREIAWVDLPPSVVASQIKVTPADVERYYAANKAEFTEPEQIRAEYLVLDMASVAAGIEVSDQAVADYYASNAAQFGQPEQRSASHILIAADKNADAATRAKAKAKATEIVSDAAENAGEFCRTGAHPVAGSGLGRAGRQPRQLWPRHDGQTLRGRGIQHEAQGNPWAGGKRFWLPHHPAGWHRGGARLRRWPRCVQPWLRNCASSRRKRPLPSLADNFSNLVYENATSLQPAAAAAKLTVQQSGWMTAKNAPPPFNHAGLSAALFSPESIKSKQNTEAIEVQPGTLVAARVVEHHTGPLAAAGRGVSSESRPNCAPSRGHNC